MNGKKARMLRSLAAVKSDKFNKQQYKQTNPVTRPQFESSVTPDGLITRKLTGTYQTFTLVLDAGSRLLYKNLKSMYHSSVRA